MHYLLFYDVTPDYLRRRQQHRADHLSYAQAAVARGELLLGGALSQPVDSAVLLFQGASPKVAESFAAGDPYVTRGLVTQWRVREWTTVVGPLAAQPAGPQSEGPPIAAPEPDDTELGEEAGGPPSSSGRGPGGDPWGEGR